MDKFSFQCIGVDTIPQINSFQFRCFTFLSLPLAIPFGAKLDDGNKAPPHDVPTAQYLHKFIMIRPYGM